MFARDNPGNDSVSVPKISEVIARKIREEILNAEMQPGDPIASEAELITRFGASRPTVREALRILESEQLVKIVRGINGGARFTLPDIELVTQHLSVLLQAYGATQRDIMIARIILEPPIIGFVCKQANADEIELLEQSIALHKQASGDIRRFSQETERFYDYLQKISRNMLLSAILIITRQIMHTQTETLLEGMPSGDLFPKRNYENNIKAKETLLRHFRERDSVEAEAIWRKHLSAQLRLAEHMGIADRRVTSISAEI